MPYDRPATTMAGFALCAPCAAEYRDPANRRFHAEPVACPQCGPTLTFSADGQPPVQGNTPALSAAVAALRAGTVLAVKGIGGYHLVCDAGNDRAVQRLRERKPRPDKPLAVMFPAPTGQPLQQVADAVRLSDTEAALLLSPQRPVVLARRRTGGTLSDRIAPGLAELGVMLPYSPLHHLLLAEFGAPLVATSANISGEPVLTDNDTVAQRLGHVAGAFLHHDRPIARPADDPVYRVIAARPRLLRPGRGCTPLELALPFRLQAPVLALGGHMKNTVALAWEDRLVISPHIGDMGSARSLAVFEQTVADLQALYRIEARQLVCDAHPGYATTRWAAQRTLPVQQVFHHHAHAAAACPEATPATPALVFTWDGVGLGPDGTLWGGEALLGSPGHWTRFASLRPFHLPGGERAGREPWRSAAALCWETGQDWNGLTALRCCVPPGKRASTRRRLPRRGACSTRQPRSPASAARPVTKARARCSWRRRAPRTPNPWTCRWQPTTPACGAPTGPRCYPSCSTPVLRPPRVPVFFMPAWPLLSCSRHGVPVRCTA
jgi:hydrogenase maturation protein HypF